MGRLDAKVAIITGAARGQGEAAARLFVEEGARVVLGDVLDEEGTQIAKELGDAATYVHHDVTSEADWANAIAVATDKFGALHVLHNNAGILLLASIEETTLADYERVIRVNQTGTFLGMKAAVAPMRAAGGGSMINVSSMDGFIGMNGIVAYGASKFAIRGMTKVAAIEFGKYGIRVNSLHPGAIDTAMQGSGLTEEEKNSYYSSQPIGRIGKPMEMAKVALFLASDDSSFCTGGEFLADGGATAGHRVPGVPGY
jgi:3alpha(or 20beta)-hydroxysteroid dehydrogenase